MELNFDPFFPTQEDRAVARHHHSNDLEFVLIYENTHMIEDFSLSTHFTPASLCCKMGEGQALQNRTAAKPHLCPLLLIHNSAFNKVVA